MSKTEKKFDAVAMTRSARDRISAEIEGMTLDEELRWLASQEIDDPFLKWLRDRAAQSGKGECLAPPPHSTPHAGPHGALPSK
jgi:hypothetical protein